MKQTTVKNLKNTAYEKLKAKIMYCEYPPGSVINEIQISNELGISRTPVREAISRLENDGFIKVMPKKGIFVTNVSLQDVQQIFRTRIEIEPLSLKLAAPYLNTDDLLNFRRKLEADDDDTNSFMLDTQMHLFIIEQCGNKYIINMMRKLFDDNIRIVIATEQHKHRIHDAKQEHIDILDSLLRKDEINKSCELMKSHIESCFKAAINYYYTLDFTL